MILAILGFLELLWRSLTFSAVGRKKYTAFKCGIFSVRSRSIASTRKTSCWSASGSGAHGRQVRKAVALAGSGEEPGGAFIVAGCVHACKICVCVYTIETMPVVSESITRTFIPPASVTILHT